ncbi:MAG: NAD-dependent malic enzyme [Thermodesulfovibrionales bacterium]|nr:NAD-dependent malic enzyme [Thermodesulfovibrionales bacterium]
MRCKTSPSYSLTIRLAIENKIGMFAKIASMISRAGGDLGPIAIVRVSKDIIVRDLTVYARDEEHEHQIISAINQIKGVSVLNVMDRTLTSHIGGKIEINNKVPINDCIDLSRVYTPGVARVCKEIFKNKEHLYNYTIKSNTVAVITDGSAVLGLGNIGPEAAMPVMEGKAMIFKEFANINAFPIALSTQDPDKLVEIIKNISVPFGGINLEDIAAPHCFYVEQRLQEELDIPIFHDDQHGTAVVILAALINVCRFLKIKLEDIKIVIAGAGAAGIATAFLLTEAGAKDLVICDTAGAIYRGRKKNMNMYKEKIANITNPQNLKGNISTVMKGANVFIGLAQPNLIKSEDVKKMSVEPRIIFALSNPDPEISPEIALKLARIVATGRSDYPNQINNMLCFPGIFRGLLDAKASKVNTDIKIAAAKAIAYSIKDEQLSEDFIIPSVFQRNIVTSVANEVIKTAKETGVVRR